MATPVAGSGRVAGLEAAAAGGRRVAERQGDHERLPAPAPGGGGGAGSVGEPQAGELFGGDLAIVEVDRHGAEDLIGLVTLAGDHERIAGPRAAQRRRGLRRAGWARPSTLGPPIARDAREARRR